MANKDTLKYFKGKVMKEKGYNVNMTDPDSVKYEIADEQGIPLNRDYNGDLTAKQAGKIGGPIGGQMVKEMVKMAQKNMAEQNE